MNPTSPSLGDALILATASHRGQTDKAGRPYILHPLQVMQNLGRDATEEERIVALLHDVVEDCEVSPQDLRERGYSETVLEALALVTKVEGEDYDEFMRRLAPNPIARRVKIADLTDNLDLSRIATPSEADFERREKYRRALDFLQKFST